jgi:prepilin peptidase CpaA
MLEWVLLIVLPTALVTAAAFDLATYTIPNWLSLTIAALFPAFAIVADLTIVQFALHIAVGFALLALAMMLFALRLFGGGDAKLIAATALWMGPPGILPFLMATALTGGALATFVILLRRLPLPAALADREWARRLHERKRGVPYGIALAGGGLAAYHTTPIAIALGAG